MDVKRPERIQEPRSESGTIEFLRIHCKEGFIDYWMGDCTHYPSYPTTSRQQVNSIISSFRLNGGEWVDGREMRGTSLLGILPTYKDLFTAEEIWAYVMPTPYPA